MEAIVRLAVCAPATCILGLEDSVAGLGILIPLGVAGGEADPRGAFAGRRILVRGRVEEVDGRPRIRVASADQIRVVDGGADAEGGRVVTVQTAPLPRQTAAATRSRIVSAAGDVRRSVPAGARSLLDSEAQNTGSAAALEPVVAALVERLTLLEATVVGLQAQLERVQPPDPGQSVPNVRVRRGWSAARLRTEAGDPTQILPAGGGGQSWIYPGGGIVTIGPDGRVDSSAGFR